MKKSEYRKYRIRAGDAAVRFLDDFAAMKQVVGRRYRKILELGGPFPDLILIDGGKGQLNAAYEALEEIGLSNLIAVGLAKREELVFLRDSEQPLAMDPHGPALRLLQHIRDEAHRFAITFHRQSRAKRDLRSELDRAGFRHVTVLGVEGPAWMLADFDARWDDPALRKDLLDVVRALEAESSVVGISAHLLGIGRKP